MRIGITGATGFIGSALGRHAAAAGHEVVAFSRKGSFAASWVAESRRITDAPDVSGCDALVHLAGESLMGFWSKAKKQRLWSSRVDLTKSLVASMEKSSSRPRVLLAGSAVGFYGSRGDELLDESSPRGAGFLSDLCVGWEAAARRAAGLGTRVVSLRTSMVLGDRGGAFPLLKRLFSFTLGGRLGGGKQWMPWIHIEDHVRLMLWCIEHEEVASPVNLAAPGAVTNAQFTTTLARRLKRPAFFHAPAFALRLLLRDMADEMLLASQRVRPKVALDREFTFRHPDLQSAVADL